MTLTAKGDGASAILIKGRGPHLRLPALPLSTPLRAQLQSSNRLCWEATYSAAVVNTTSQFRARTD